MIYMTESVINIVGGTHGYYIQYYSIIVVLCCINPDVVTTMTQTLPGIVLCIEQ